MNYGTLTPNVLDTIPSLGALFGTTASSELIDEINNSLPNSGVFGSSLDPFKEQYNIFNDQIIQPILQTQERLQDIYVVSTLSEDQIVSIWSYDQLQYELPQSMQLPILLYPPVMNLYLSDQIVGYDEYEIDKENPPNDLYGDMIKGIVQDMEYDQEEGYISTHYCENDWDLNYDELEDIIETREFIDEVLETTDLDPTDMSNKRK
jgi:hypothetical protein